MKNPILIAFLVLALVSLACGFNINLPERVQPGPDQTMSLDVEAPASGSVSLTLNFGAGQLKIAPGAQNMLVQGTATYNLPELKPEIVKTGSDILIKQGPYEFKSVIGPNDLKNIWDIKLGDTPMALTIEAGAYQGEMALGGLPLTSLSIKDGAAQTDVTFDAPNPEEMSTLRYETGASSVTLTGLGNANFGSLIFKSGAGDYTLDFTGELKRDATVSLETGLSNTTLRIPKGVHVVLTVDGGLSNVNTSSSWTKSDNTYTQEGDGPTLTIDISMGAGSLTLTD